MENIEISIIIPVYNTEKYLSECIQSVINQTITNLEIILINDGSTDNSLKICKKYEKIDKRVKVINKNNTGVSDCRNIGITKAIGTYIFLLDADDYLELNALETLLSVSKKTNCDVVFGSYTDLYLNKTLKATTFDNETISVFNNSNDKIQFFNNLCIGGENDCFINSHYNSVYCAWGKLIKTQILKKLNPIFPINMKIHEDDLFNIILFYNVDKTFFTNTNIIYYRKRKTSCSNDKKLSNYYNNLNYSLILNNLRNNSKIYIDELIYKQMIIRNLLMSFFRTFSSNNYNIIKIHKTIKITFSNSVYQNVISKLSVKEINLYNTKSWINKTMKTSYLLCVKYKLYNMLIILIIMFNIYSYLLTISSNHNINKYFD